MVWYDISKYITNRMDLLITHHNLYTYGTYKGKYYGNYDNLCTLLNIDNNKLISESQLSSKQLYWITPLNIVKYCVNLVMPMVYDLCCGSGSFLVESAIYLHKNNKNINWLKQCKKMYGYDIDKLMVDLTITNFKVSINIQMNEQIKIANTIGYKNKYNVLLMNPPFGKALGTEELVHEQFLLVAMENLEFNGRCSIIMPTGFLLFRNSIMKQRLIEEFNVIECGFTTIYNCGMVIIYFINDGNRTNKILLKNIDNNTEIKTVTYDEIIKNDYKIHTNNISINHLIIF